MPSVIRATRSPPFHSASRPYGLSMISVVTFPLAPGAGATAGGVGAGAAAAGAPALSAGGALGAGVAGCDWGCACAASGVTAIGNASIRAAARIARRFIFNMLSPCECWSTVSGTIRTTRIARCARPSEPKLRRCGAGVPLHGWLMHRAPAPRPQTVRRNPAGAHPKTPWPRRNGAKQRRKIARFYTISRVSPSARVAARRRNTAGRTSGDAHFVARFVHSAPDSRVPSRAPCCTRWCYLRCAPCRTIR